ncbi:transcriptional regulator, TetR family [Faunimonas pinastri]|uniref:Transcriptional regulator, TetR family n=1 Tax=Faunimonas pinastri TaxID=1855383 RepID=A0A1H9Q499_9HYPH|nr:TetR/AcrR family transcriptional regulator [Faunimonas pinastri]SER55260.1 transcriptional regulator, TetR family [Faunimonas pinastri]
MEKKTRPPSPLGRPRSSSAGSHDVILTAVYDLLQEMSVRELTMEKVAKRAGVGKPTLYRWWKTKAALVIAMFNERIVPELEAPQATTVEDAIRQKVERLIAAFNGFFGKVVAELVAEGQSDPNVLNELNEHYVKPRRAGTVNDIIEAQRQGLVPAHIDPELVVDAIFGALYFNLLLKIRPLTPDYGDSLVQNCKKLLDL